MEAEFTNVHGNRKGSGGHVTRITPAIGTVAHFAISAAADSAVAVSSLNKDATVLVDLNSL